MRRGRYNPRLDDLDGSLEVSVLQSEGISQLVTSADFPKGKLTFVAQSEHPSGLPWLLCPLCYIAYQREDTIQLIDHALTGYQL